MSQWQRITSVPKLPVRARDGHKGEYGTVLVVGGARRMIGAPALTATAALRGGAGLVVMATPALVQLAVASLCECATSVPLKTDSTGALTAEAVRQLTTESRKADVLAVGPGMDVGVGRQNLVQAALRQDKPVVLDADGLNNLAAIDGWPALRTAPLVLTPHPGEFSRLTGKPVADIQADRETAVRDALTDWTAPAETDAPLVLVLKGAGTLVAEGDRLYVNDTGNPGMASGGAGDVLTGVIAAMLAQGLSPFDAACLGVWLHGRAGDLAAATVTEESLIASDLVAFLPDAMKDVVGGPPKD
jgi:NAD(P)H-hydrate epimerase